MSDLEISYQTTISILQQRLKNVEELKNKIQRNLDYSLKKINKLKNEKKDTEDLIYSIGFPIRTSRDFLRMNNEEKIDTNNKLEDFFANVNAKLYNRLRLKINKVDVSVANDGITNHNFKFKINEKIWNNFDNRELTSLYTKDFLRISDHGYTFLKKQLDVSLPSIHVIKKIRGMINKNFEIEKLGNGCIVDPKIVIIDKLIKLHEKSPSIFENERIKVKLSADGTNISRNVKILNVIFSIINEDLKAATASGSYLFALAPYEKENYDQISPLMSRTWDLIKGLYHVEINNVVKYIDLFVCADYKMNLNLAGLKMANSLEPCLYCTASKRHLHELGEKRTVIVYATLIKLDNGKKICEILDGDFYDIALYDYIMDENNSHWIHSEKMLIKLPIDRFIIDLLHLFLRVSDKLFSNLIETIKTIDKFSNKFNPKKHKNIEKLIIYLKECKIPVNDFYNEENSISKIFTSLQGPHRIKFFNRIVNDESFLKLLESMPNIEKPKEIYSLWKDFYSILSSIKSEQLPDLDYTQGLVNNWFVKYVSLYTQTSVTPYMHIFNYHLIDQYKKYGNINYFNTQGLEKLNDLSTMDYFKATNKKDDFCFQILKRNMRMSYLDSIINIKPKRKYTRRSDDYTESNEDEIEVDGFENDDDNGDFSSKKNKIIKIN